MGSERAQDALTREELEALLRAINGRSTSGKRAKAMVLVMSDGGLRVGEALGLGVGDLVVEGGQYRWLTIRRTKTGEPRDVPVNDRMNTALAAWTKARRSLRARGGPLFCTLSKGLRHGFDGAGKARSGRPLSRQYVWALLRRLAKRAKIEKRLTPHTLRHTCATELMRLGMPTPVVQKLLGHKSAATTADVYSHVRGDDVQKAVEALGGTPMEDPLASLTHEQKQALVRLVAQRDGTENGR